MRKGELGQAEFVWESVEPGSPAASLDKSAISQFSLPDRSTPEPGAPIIIDRGAEMRHPLDVRFPISVVYGTGEMERYASAEDAAFDLEFFSTEHPEDPPVRVLDATGCPVKLTVECQAVLLCELDSTLAKFLDAPTEYQQRALSKIWPLLRAHGIDAEFRWSESDVPTLVAEFSSRAHGSMEIHIHACEVLLHAGPSRFELYDRRWPSDERTDAEELALRLDRFLGGGDW